MSLEFDLSFLTMSWMTATFCVKCSAAMVPGEETCDWLSMRWLTLGEEIMPWASARVDSVAALKVAETEEEEEEEATGDEKVEG